MKNTNFLGDLFKYISTIINSGEKSFLDLLSALVPYAVPIIPAYLTYFHTRDLMQFPPNIAASAAFVVEVLGMTSVSTAIRFWRHNLRYKQDTNRAPFWLALATYIFYLVIVLAVNVILEVEQGDRSNTVIWAIGLFSLLSVPSGVLISIRAQYAQILEERAERRLSQSAVMPAETERPELSGHGRPKIEKVCAGCGRNFTTTFPNKVTCSDACRKRLSRSKSHNVP